MSDANLVIRLSWAFGVALWRDGDNSWKCKLLGVGDFLGWRVRRKLLICRGSFLEGFGLSGCDK